MGMFDSITGALSGGLIEPGGGDFYPMMAKNEAQRRALINMGMKNINAVFGGGTTDIYSPAKKLGTFDPTKDYYYLKGETPTLGWQGKWAPYYGLKGEKRSPFLGMDEDTAKVLDPGGVAGGLVGATIGGKMLEKVFNRENQMERFSRLAKNAFATNDYFLKDTKTFEGFGPKFFQDRAKAYYDYANPLLNEQYDMNRRATMYGLANRGLLDSTQGSEANSRLERTAGQARQGVIEQAFAQANALKKQVEDARNQAINQLYQTADPSMALNSAISAASSVRQPSVFGPLANMFSSLANTYITNQMLDTYKTGGMGYGGDSYSMYAPLGPVTYGGG